MIPRFCVRVALTAMSPVAQEHLGGASWGSDSGEGTTLVAAEAPGPGERGGILMVEGPADGGLQEGVATSWPRERAKRRSSMAGSFADTG